MAKIEILKESLESFTHNKNVCGFSQSEVITKRMIAPIDEKNVCSGWIEQIFDDYNLTQIQNRNIHKMCGYIKGELVECTFQFGDNEMNWYIYSLYSNLDMAKSALLERLKKYENEESNLFSEIQDHETYLTQRFYFKGE